MEQRLPGVGALLKTAWADYTARPYFFSGIALLYMLAMYAIMFIFAMAFAMLAPMMSQSIVIPGIILGVLVVVGFVVMLLLQTMSLVSVTSQGRTALFAEVSSRSWGMMWSYAWLMLLTTLVVMGGFTLLIVPGIIVSVLLAFAMFIFAEEGVTGMDALLKSSAYVRGRWWAVLWRMVGITTILLVANILLMLLSAVLQIPLIDVIGSAVLSVVTTPLFMLYFFALYTAVKSQSEASPLVYENKRTMYTIFSIVGLLFVPTIVALSMWAAVSMQFSSARAQSMGSMADLKMMQVALELYFDGEGKYPETLDALVAKGYMGSLPLSAPLNAPYAYEYISDVEYLLCDPKPLVPESLSEGTGVRRCVSPSDMNADESAWEGGGDAGDPVFE